MFEQAFPFYLFIGMTYEQYWEGDSWLVKYYRKAYEMRQEEQNRAAWLHGMYIYEAIADISPVLHPFAKRGTRARKYPEKPYEFQKPHKEKQQNPDNEAKRKSEKIRAMMFAAMQKTNENNARKRIAEALAKETEGAADEEKATVEVTITET